jgi:hypothetical protein
MNLRPYIRGTLWAGGLLVLALAIAGTLWLVLGAAGDQGGSQGAKGVAFFAVVGLMLDVLTLIVLLALTELSRQSVRPHEENPPAKSPQARGQGSSTA